MERLSSIFDARLVSVTLVILNLFFLYIAWFHVGQNVTASYMIGVFASITSVGALVLYDQNINRILATWLIISHTIILVLTYSRIYLDYNILYNGQPFTDETFTDNIYFSIVTLTTLGYGDFQPPPKLRILAGIQAITGYVYLGFIISIASSYGGRKSHNRQFS